jgi:prepilin-type N-terminal cleavage/methylation domain-containing protein
MRETSDPMHRPRAGNRAGCRWGAHQQAAAFSLIEMLIALALVVTMYVLYLSGGSQRFQTRQKVACQQNLQNAYMALKTFSIENRGQFPVLTNAASSEAALSLLVPRCTTVTDIFMCPGTKEKPPPSAKPFANARINYAYYMGRHAQLGPRFPLLSDEQVDTNEKFIGQPLFSADGKGRGNNHHQYGGVILVCDGSAQISGTNATMALPLGAGVQLLNPKP